MAKLQVYSLHSLFDRLQRDFGDQSLCPVYGAGCTTCPDLMLIFMNPTARNISSSPDWSGIRAPWLGTKNIWRLLSALGAIDRQTYASILDMSAREWNPDFSRKLYENIAENKFFITNLAKCTQVDARPLSNLVFRSYRNHLLREIALVRPNRIVTFGNQVSSIVLDESVRVGDYRGNKKNTLRVGLKDYPVYPVHYPVGQGMRNLGKAVLRLKLILRTAA